jgi:DNA-binding transcriptional LysR family regulator
VELKQLQAFVAAADSGSLAEAAARLGQSESTVSKLLSALEKRFGVRLLARRPLRLTAPGTDFLPAARAAVEAVRAADEAGRRAKQASLPALVVGVESDLEAVARRFITELGAATGLSVRTQKLSEAADPIQLLRLGEAASVICRSPAGATGVIAEPLHRIRVCAVFAEDHRLAAHEEVSWSDLEAEACVLPDDGEAPWHPFELRKLLGRRAPSLAFEERDRRFPRVVDQVGLGDAWTPVPAEAWYAEGAREAGRELRDEDREVGGAFLVVVDPPEPQAETALSFARNSYPTPIP